MAQHKAPTQVTVASTEERSAFSLWVEKNWKSLVVLAVLASAGILVWQWMQQREQQAVDASWNRLREVTELGTAGVLVADPDELAPVVAELTDTSAGPWALYVEALSLKEEHRIDEALQVLEQLQGEYGNHYLNTERFAFGGGTPLTIVEHMSATFRDMASWSEKMPQLYENPAPPADAPRVRIQTDQGDIVVALYADQSPNHVDNFLKLCGEGYYDGIKFHRIDPNFMIQGGDPNSRDGDPSTWGQGGPDFKLDAEKNDLAHFRGVLSAATTPPDPRSSGSQFFITVRDAHWLDGQHTIFGTVVEGMEVADQIAGGELAAGTQDRPKNPVTIQGTTILE